MKYDAAEEAIVDYAHKYGCDCPACHHKDLMQLRAYISLNEFLPEDDPMRTFSVTTLGGAATPMLSRMRDFKKRADSTATIWIVTCGCEDGRTEGHRLGDGRCLICPHCDALIARVGNKIVAALW